MDPRERDRLGGCAKEAIMFELGAVRFPKFVQLRHWA